MSDAGCKDTENNEVQCILGAGGVIADELMRELATRVDCVRLVQRHPQPPRPRMEARAADLLNPWQTADAVKGSSVAYLVAGLPYRSGIWKEQWPIILKNVIEACKMHRVRLVFLDDLSLYGMVDGPISEDANPNPCSLKGEVRARLGEQLQAQMREGNLQAMIVRASDFYGPGATKSFTHALVFEMLASGRKAAWLGRDDMPHSLVFTPDAGRALAALGNSPQSFGQTWLLPCAPNPPNARDFIVKAAESFGVRPSWRVLGPRMLRVAGLFHTGARETLEILYQYTRPHLVDSAKFKQSFFEATPWQEGVRLTARGMMISKA